MNIFHLAIEGGDLEVTLPFYTDILGCELGPFEPEISAELRLSRYIQYIVRNLNTIKHQTIPRKRILRSFRNRHKVDMGEVCVPHYGIHLSYPAWAAIKSVVEEEYQFLDDPFVRFEGTDRQQETFFVEDPNLNVLEIKSIQGDFYVNGHKRHFE